MAAASMWISNVPTCSTWEMANMMLNTRRDKKLNGRDVDYTSIKVESVSPIWSLVSAPGRQTGHVKQPNNPDIMRH
jgi:hypothetical protein